MPERHRQPDTCALRTILSRRRVLAGLPVSVAGAILAACAAQRRPEPTFGGPGSGQELASPRPAGTATPVPAATPATGFGLHEFLAISSVLTGFDSLSPTLGQAYLAALRATPDGAGALADLYDRAGFRSGNPPSSTAELEQVGLFSQDQTRALADRIMTYWYTGIVETPDGQQQVVTFTDALAWKSIVLIKAPTICGPRPGFWAERPPVVP